MTGDTDRRIFIAGNWKMHKTPAEAGDFISRLKVMIPQDPGVDVALAPPFPALEASGPGCRRFICLHRGPERFLGERRGLYR